MDEYWDSEDQWVDEGEKCVVCFTRVQDAVICSVTCADVLSIRQDLLV